MENNTAEPFGTQQNRDTFLAAVMKFPSAAARERGLAIHKRMVEGRIDANEVAVWALQETLHVMSMFSDSLSEAADKLEQQAQNGKQ